MNRFLGCKLWEIIFFTEKEGSRLRPDKIKVLPFLYKKASRGLNFFRTDREYDIINKR